MNITLDGVIQANGGPTKQDGGLEYAGWERPYWDVESGEQVSADVQASDALLLGRTTYDIFRDYWLGKTTWSGGRSTGSPSTSNAAARQSCPGTPAPRLRT
jgi:dihydrofolate reductase